MERYENLGLVGEGSYGMVLKCRHKETGQIVAIKKFIESEDDKMVKKIAMREIKMLKQLRHENLVNLLEVFRRKRRLFLVFEFVDRTVLDDLEKYPDGLEDVMVKKISFQVLRGLEFCHSHNIIHRDVKPENILISKSGIVKLCDFGFARTLATGPGEVFTDYVATRWYRAPELLVGDVNYGKAVDIWAVGCLLFEMITGDPLFPGDSDIDQLFHITKALGNLTQRHQEVFHRNPLFTGMRLPTTKKSDHVGKRFSHMMPCASDLIMKSLALDASHRLSCLEMMKHEYYQEKNFAQSFLETLKLKIEKETTTSPLLKSLAAQKSMKLHNNNNTTTNNNNKSNSNESKENKTKVIETKNHMSDVKIHEKKKKKDPKTEIGNQQNQNHQQQQQQRSIKAIKSKEGISHEHNSDARQGLENTSLDLTNSNQVNNTITENKSSHENLSKRDAVESPESKFINRTTLDLSINQPGKNLPDINNTIVNRARGHDVIKHKKVHSKKSFAKPEREVENSMLCPVAEKAPIYLEHSKSFEEIIKSDKYKRKDSKLRESSELEFPRVSGLTLPSVKGAESKNSKLSPTRGSKKVTLTSTIPHIQNIDPFSTTFSPSKETMSSNSRVHRDGNLPAV